MPKFMRFKADGFIIAHNEALVDNPNYEVVEADEAPHLQQFCGATDAPAAPVKAGKKKSAETNEPGAKTGDAASDDPQGD